MMRIASKGHLLTHWPQPMQSVSEMKQIVEVTDTSMQSLPTLLTGHFLLHSCWHFFGLHLSGLMIAILILSSELSTIYWAGY
jgi:hypothetical protein